MKRFAWLFLLAPALAGAVELGSVPGVSIPRLGAAPHSQIPAVSAQMPGQLPAAPQAPAAQQSLQRAAMPSQAENVSPQAQFNAGRQAFDGLGQYDDPDTQYSWHDEHTGQQETQASKIKKALELALSHQLGGAIKNALPYNTLYRVDNGGLAARYMPYTTRTVGDDPERPQEESPLVIFHKDAVRFLSPEYLAAKLASMWARHLYRDTMPVSAEKTYVEGSVFVRVFMGLTGSNSGWWNGDKDRVVSVPGHWDNGQWVTQNFEAFLHQYFWRQGSDYQDVRQGPYFKDKIMGAQGQPDIDADARGRRTLFQRAQNGEISQDAAAAAQQRFQGFVSNERR